MAANKNMEKKLEDSTTRQVIRYLPHHIIVYDVLVRMPAKQVCVLKTVCKPWLSLISNPSFATHHHDHTRLSNADTIILTTCSVSQSHTLSRTLAAPDEGIFSIDLATMRVETLTLNFPDPGLALSVKASCNGLLLLCDQQMRLYVHNPVTAVYNRLPDVFAVVDDDIMGLFCGIFPYFQWAFFYDERVGKNKVCGFLVMSGFHCIGILLTLGDDSWTEFPDHDTHINSFQSGAYFADHMLSPVFLDNKLYWLGNLDSHFIVWMSIPETEFGTMEAPVEQLDQRHFLSSVKGSLCVTSLSSDRLEMFVLEDGEQGTWVNRCSITHSLFSDLPTFATNFSRDDFGVVVAREFDGSDLSGLMKIFIHEEDQLICYDMKHQERSVIGTLGREYWLRGIYHFHSATFVQV